MIEKYQDKKSLFRWRLRAQNGNIIAESGQGYKSQNGMEKGLQAAIKGLGVGATSKWVEIIVFKPKRKK